jgi:SPP1 family predicted phage head-tail adaptor
MQAGKLDKRITIQRRYIERDTFGGEVITWPTVCVVWARVQPLSGREFLEGKQMEEERTVRITIRYRQDVRPSMQVSWKGRTYDIVDVSHSDESGRETTLMCRELIAEVIPDGQ